MQMFELTHGLPAIPPGVIKDDADFVARTIDTALAGGAPTSTGGRCKLATMPRRSST